MSAHMELKDFVYGKSEIHTDPEYANKNGIK